MRDKSEYALLWANGMSFSEIYDLMEAEICEPWQAADTEGDED
jgi:hypothetical protein